MDRGRHREKGGKSWNPPKAANSPQRDNQATSRTNEKPINVNKNGRMTINMLGRGFWYPQFLVDCQERIDTSIPCSGPWFRRYAELKPLPRRGKHFSDFPRVIGNLELEQELERRSWLDL